MNYESKLKDYNEQVKNWNFKKQKLNDYLTLLTARNTLIYDNTPFVNFQKLDNIDLIYLVNTAFIFASNSQKPQNLAYHVAYPKQTSLCSLIDETTKAQNNGGVFFSMNPEDVNFFSNSFEDSPQLMVYFLDLQHVKSARVQTDYSKEVISRYDLNDLFDNSKKFKPEDLKSEHKRLNRLWIERNTVPFDYDKIKQFKEKNNDWLIVPGPIYVSNSEEPKIVLSI